MIATIQRGATRIGGLALVLLVCGLVMSHKGVLDGVSVTEGVLPVIAQGVIQGLLYALFAVGLVLVSRASRTMNFAHGGMLAVSYVLFYSLAVSLGFSYWL